jgi:6-pyruvoyltetrahydropterin/6-carboxytetrahydropterin synthase
VIASLRAGSGSHGVRIEHNFETAHRLPVLGGKCTNLHGHSWRAAIHVDAPALDANGCVVEFGAWKHLLRDWIDTHLDHGTMLGAADPLLDPICDAGSKVFVFDPDGPGITARLDWPTVESVAVLLARVAAGLLGLAAPVDGAEVAHVRVQETAVNAATWTAP